MVGMMRAHMADPHIVRKLEAGQADRIRPCVGASMCINRLYLGLDALCIHNPATGREETIPHADRRGRPGRARRVVVVGAGPAGLEAARVAAERGHSVVLLEAAAQPGGQVVLAARATARRRDLIGIVDWLAAECRHARRRPAVRASSPTRRRSPALGPDVVDRRDRRAAAAAAADRGRRPRRHAPGTSSAARSRRRVATVLLFDDHGTEDALSCAERMVAGRLDGRDRHARPARRATRSTGTAYPAYLAAFYAAGVRMTPDHRLTRRPAHARTAGSRSTCGTTTRGRRRSGSSTRSSSSTARCRTTSSTSSSGRVIERRRAGPRRVHRRSAAGAWSRTRPGRTSCSGSATPSRAAPSTPRSTRPAGSRCRSDGASREPAAPARDARHARSARSAPASRRRRSRSARLGVVVRALRRLGRCRGLRGRDVRRRSRPDVATVVSAPGMSSGAAGVVRTGAWHRSIGAAAGRSSSIGMWQLIRCPGSTSMSGGSVTSHTPRITRGQRVLKTQPLGGLAGLGISPSSRIRAPLLTVDVRHGREQRLGVRVVRAVEDGLGIAHLHDPAEVHDRDPVREVADDAEVVRDQQVARPALQLELGQQVQDRGLDRDVEGTRRLVGDDDLAVRPRTRARSPAAASGRRTAGAA